MTMRSDFSTSP